MSKPLVLIDQHWTVNTELFELFETYFEPLKWCEAIGPEQNNPNPQDSESKRSANVTRLEEVQAICVYMHPQIDAEVLAKLPNLKAVCNFGAGYDHIDVEALARRKIPVSNTPGAVNDATAEMGMALMLASARNLIQGCALTKDQKTTGFDSSWLGVQVTGATVGIVGMGRIGQVFAKRAAAFDMRVIYHNRSEKKEAKELGYEYCSTLDSLLEEADFVVLVVCVTSETINLISTAQFSKMKRTATLINIARGKVVDQEALVEALQSGQIRAAALDVTEPEPLPRDHPLLTLDNCIISPHIGSATLPTRLQMMQIVCENILAAVKGDSLPNLVPEHNGVFE